MAAENLGELEAGVKLVPETEAAEKAIADFSAKTKRQLESIGGQTLTQLTQNFDGLTNAVTGGLDAINSGIAKIRNVASLGFLGGGVAGIVNQIFQTRSYFQDAASSMKTFLGDADKAAKFTKELQEYAFYNMYEFQDLVGVSKQLIAYGTKDTKEIIQVTDQLSNIATGTGANIYEMVDIFNKIKARGTADGQVLQQLASRGLVVKDVLQQMGETVSGNKITFEQFQKVLAHVTGEGGMFHDLMKDQLNNLSASAAQLSDVMTNMWNEIGEQAEPYMKEAIDFAGMVVENYKEVAAVLFDIAKAYGIYKVAAKVMEWNENSKAAENAERFEKEKEALEGATEATEDYAEADIKARVAKGQLTEAQAKELLVIQQGLEKRKQELEVVQRQAATEIAAAEKEIAALKNKITMQERSIKATYDLNRASELNSMKTQLETLEKGRLAAAERAENAQKQISAINTARDAAAQIADANATSLLTRAKLAAGAAIKGIGSSIMSMVNPTALATAAVGYLVTKLIELATAETALDKAKKRSAELQDEYNANVGTEKAKIDELFGALDAAAKGYGDVDAAKKAIQDNYGQYLKNLSDEKRSLDDIKGAYDAITEAMVQRYKYEALGKAKAQHEASLGDADKEMYSGLIAQIDDNSNIRENTALKKQLEAFVKEYEDVYMGAQNRINKAIRDTKGESRAGRVVSAQRRQEEQRLEAFKKKWAAQIEQLEDRGISMFDSDSDLNDAINRRREAINAANIAWENDQVYYQNSWEDFIKKNNLNPDGTEKREGGTTPTATARIAKAKGDDKKFIQEYAKLVEERNKKIADIEKEYGVSDEVKKYRIAQLTEQYGWKLEDLTAGNGLTPEQEQALVDIYDKATAAELAIAREEYKKRKEEIARLQQTQSGIKLSDSKATQDELDNRMRQYNGISAKIAKLTAEMEGYEATIQKTFEASDFVKKADAYAKFADEYSKSLIAEKEKENEIKRRIKELDAQANKATPEQAADIERQRANAQLELDNFRKEQETKRQILIEGFDETATDVTSLINNIMTEVTKLSFDEIQKKIVRVNAKLRQLNAQKQMGEDVAQEIAETTANLALLQGAAEEAKKAMESGETKETIDYWNDSKKAVNSLTNAFKSLGSAIGGSTEEALNTASMVLTTTVSLVDNIVTFTTTSISAIKTAETAGVAAVKAVEAASVILAIISAVIQLGQAIASLFNKKDPIDELKDSLHDFNLELEETKRLTANDASFKPFETIFGDDVWGAMTNNIRIGAEAWETYKKTQQDIIHNAQTMTGQMKQGVGGAIGSAILTGGLWSGGNHSAVTAAGQYDNVDDTVANMKVKVQHKTWIRNEKSSTLKDFVPSLFNDQGELDKDALHKFVESNNDAFQKLSQDNQDYLRKMDESWQEYQEAVAAVKDTFSEFFGDLGSQIQDMWTNAFRSGEDGLADFEKSWDSAIENMIQSMAYSKTLGKVMSDMENKLDDVGFFDAPEANMDKAVGIMEEYEQEALAKKEIYDQILETWRQKGYFKEEEAQRQAVSGGIANVTQDTAEEMNGRLTQIQSHTFSINEGMKQMVTMQTTQLAILQGIHTDTARLATIQGEITAVRAAVADIQIKGIKLKS